VHAIALHDILRVRGHDVTPIKTRKVREGVALLLYDNKVAAAQYAGHSAELELSMAVIERYQKDRESTREELMRTAKLSELTTQEEESPKVHIQPDQ
jgi:hypothetical protein